MLIPSNEHGNSPQTKDGLVLDCCGQLHINIVKISSKSIKEWRNLKVIPVTGLAFVLCDIQVRLILLSFPHKNIDSSKTVKR
jgi:hypothetical protein